MVLTGFASCSKKDKGGDSGSSGGTAKASSSKGVSASSALKALQGTDPAAISKALSGLDAAGIASITQKNGSPSGDFSYDLNKAGDGIVIKEYTGQGGVVIVPEKIEDIPVVEIGDSAFWNNKSVLAVVLPGTIWKINWAFSGCENLAAVNLPAGLEYIGRGAFSHTAITEIKIPEGIQVIGDETFSSCKSLLSVSLPASLKAIGSRAFSSCTELADITIPDSITSLEWVRWESAHSHSGQRDKAWTADWTPATLKSGDDFDHYYFPITADSGNSNNIFIGCGKLKLAVRQKLKDLGYTGEF
jgi:hypothetical protein